MQNKAMIFTVTDTENAGKPIVWAQSANSVHQNDQTKAEQLVWEWADRNMELYDKDQLRSELKDVAYAMRHGGYGWFGERWCFELTEIYS